MFTNLKLMCDQNNIKDQSLTNFKLKRLMCDQNNLEPICNKPRT